MFGMVLAFSKMSPIVVLAPMATASKAVRTKPRTRDTIVPAAMMALDLAVLCCAGFWAGILVSDIVLYVLT